MERGYERLKWKSIATWQQLLLFVFCKSAFSNRSVQLMAAWVFFRFHFQKSGIGSVRASILEGVKVHGTITATAVAIGMTKRQTWTNVKLMNEQLGDVIKIRRGGTGGGAELTERGEAFLSTFRNIERRFYDIFADDLAALDALIGDDSKGEKCAPRFAWVSKDPNNQPIGHRGKPVE